MKFSWYDDELEQLDDALADGLINGKEYQLALWKLNSELREVAEEQADKHYDHIINHW